MHAAMERLVTRITHDKAISFNIDNENGTSLRLLSEPIIIDFLNIVNETYVP